MGVACRTPFKSWLSAWSGSYVVLSACFLCLDANCVLLFWLVITM